MRLIIGQVKKVGGSFRDTDSGVRFHCHKQAVWIRVKRIRHVTVDGVDHRLDLPIMVNIESDAGRDS